MTGDEVRKICLQLLDRIETKHICVFSGMTDPLFLISDTYFGVWLEHVFDAVLYAEMFPQKGIKIAENTIRLFLSLQSKEGQFPCYIWDKNRSKLPFKKNIGWAQIQECVSFGQIALRVISLSEDQSLPGKVYFALKRWVEWLRQNRMKTHRGLVEMFVGYDTGHDNSGRLDGLRFRNNYIRFGAEQNAAKMHPFDRVAPVLATDMNAVLYGNLTALSVLAEKLSLFEEKERWVREAKEVKNLLFKYCYDSEDDFFYDVDKKGKKRKYLSSTILHFFQEGVLDKTEDKDVIEKIIYKHILNEKEFWTPYPFPSMAISDPSTKKHKKYNDWGYFTQGNTCERTILWMDKYDLNKEQDRVCERWLEGWTKCFEKMPVGQELDPVTGKPSPSSPWYSSGMLFYLWSAKRLGYFD